MKFDIWVYFSKICRENSSFIKIWPPPPNGYWTWSPIHIFYHISLSSSYNEKRFRQNCIENQNTRFTLKILLSTIVPRWDKEQKHNIQPDRLQMTTLLMRFAYSIIKATNTHSEYVILITSPLQQHLQESALMLRYTYIKLLAPELFFKFSTPCI